MKTVCETIDNDTGIKLYMEHKRMIKDKKIEEDFSLRNKKEKKKI